MIPLGSHMQFAITQLKCYSCHAAAAHGKVFVMGLEQSL